MTGLDIPRSTVKDRLVQADCLIGGIDESGAPLPPWLPKLSQQFANPEVDPRPALATGTKLHSVRKDLDDGEAGEAQKEQLESQAPVDDCRRTQVSP